MKTPIDNQWLQLIFAVGMNFLRYFIFAGLAYFIFYVWKRNEWFYRKIQKRLPENKEIWREFRYSMSTVLIFAGFTMLIWYSKKNNWTMIYNNIDQYGWGYWTFSLIFMILYHDTWFYWTHRWMHSSPQIFKIFHRVHHLSNNPTPWAAFAFHPTEAVVEALFLPIIVFVVPFHFSVLGLFMLWMIALNVMGHLGYEVIPKRFYQTWLGRWQNTSTHHNMHHHRIKGNYGLYFNFWDTWMGTNFENYEAEYQTNVAQVKER